MDCIYSSHTFTHQWIIHQEQSGVQYLVQGHWRSNNRPDKQTGSTSWAIAVHMNSKQKEQHIWFPLKVESTDVPHNHITLSSLSSDRCLAKEQDFHFTAFIKGNSGETDMILCSGHTKIFHDEIMTVLFSKLIATIGQKKGTRFSFSK